MKGRRDDHIRIRVPQDNCCSYNSKVSGRWIEVRLPGGNADEWNSFMVEPSQVFYDHKDADTYNILENINRDTKIIVSTKRAINHSPYREIVPNTDIIYDPLAILMVFEDCNKDSSDYAEAQIFVSSLNAGSVVAEEPALDQN